MTADRVGEPASDPNTWQAVLAMSVLGIIGANVVIIMPIIIGAVADSVGLSGKQIGLIASAEFIGMAAGTLAVALRVHRWNRRNMALSMLAIMLIGNLVSVAGDSLTALLITRLLSGLGEGALVALMTAGVVSTRAPDRIFGAFLVANLSFAALSFKVVPVVIGDWGADGAFVWLAALAGIGTVVLRWFPARVVAADTRSGGDAVDTEIAFVPAALGLFAMLIFFVCIGGVWTYMERIGVSLGITAEAVANDLAGASLVGILGAALVAWLGTRWTRTMPLAVGIFTLAGSLMLLLYDPERFSLVVPMFVWAWIVSLSYLTGAMAIIDPLGRVASIGVAMQSAGLAIGPAIAALIVDGGSYLSLAWMGTICCALCMAAILPVVIPADRPAPAT